MIEWQKPIQTLDGRPALLNSMRSMGCGYPTGATITNPDGTETKHMYAGDGTISGLPGDHPDCIMNVPEIIPGVIKMPAPVISPIQVAVTEYSPTAAALADLLHRYGSAVFNVTNSQGMKDAKAARAELKSLRTSLEAKRKEIKAPVLAQAELIDNEAKRITALIEALEKPIDAQIKAEEKRKEEEKAARERAERERVNSILEKVNELRVVPMMMTGKPATEIQEAIHYLGSMLITDAVYMEFASDAQQAVNEAIAKLLDMHKRQEAHEAEQARLAAERAELEQLRKEREAEETRLAQEREELAAEQRRLEAAKANQSAPAAATGNLVTTHRGKRFDLKTQEHIAKFKMRAAALLETHAPDELRTMLEEVIAEGVPA